MTRKSVKGTFQVRLWKVQGWECLARYARYKPRHLAIFCHVPLRSLQRHFAAQGICVKHWLAHRRMQDAKNLLCRKKKIEVTARQLFYTQTSTFIFDFKRVFGVTPGQFSLSREAEQHDWEVEFDNI